MARYQPDPPPAGKGGWAPPARGGFTGIDYRERGAIRGLDPYLVWADVSGFAHLPAADGQSARTPEWLPILLVLADGVAPEDVATRERRDLLRVPGAYTARRSTGEQAANVVPATVRRRFFEALQQDATLRAQVRHIDVDVPQDLPDDTQLPGSNRPPVQGMPSATEPGRRKLLAFIDDGCAFAHPHLLTGDPAVPTTLHTRVQRLWDQNPRPGLPAGRDFSGAELDALIAAHTASGRVDEASVYAAAAGSASAPVNRLRERAAHGAHVMDLACGPFLLEDTLCARFNPIHVAGDAHRAPTWHNTSDDAAEAPVIFVQLPMRTVQDTSGRGTMTQDVMNALQYILSQTAHDTDIVVNLSWGTLAGPHDGSAALERHIDSLVASQGGRLQVVLPAGNGFQSRTHARLFLTPAEPRHTLQWRVQPDDRTESYLELWLAPGTQVQVTVTPPDGAAGSGPVTEGMVRVLADPADPSRVRAAITYAAAGISPPGLLVALAPTASLDPARPLAPHGAWRVEVTLPAGAPPTVVDAYIERDDVALGTRRGARQSYLEEAAYDKAAKVDPPLAAPPPALPLPPRVRREGIFNAIATGASVVVAAGLRENDRSFAEYSPTGIYTLPVRPRAATPIDHASHCAITEESVMLHGVRAAGTRAGATVRLSGTSMAAPQVARDLFNVL